MVAGDGAVAAGVVRVCAAMLVDARRHSPGNQFMADDVAGSGLFIRVGVYRVFHYLSNSESTVMNTSYSIQLVIVIGIVGVSALYMLGKMLPRLRMSAAQHLQRTHYPAWINSLGARLNGGAGCGSCDTCGSCAPKSKTAAEHN